MLPHCPSPMCMTPSWAPSSPESPPFPEGTTRGAGTADLGVNGRREDGGNGKQAVVEGDLLKRVLAHGPHHHHVAVSLV